MDRPDGSARSDTLIVEQIAGVRERLSNIEGQMKSLATKEDVANAKINLVQWALPLFAAILAAVVIVAGNALVNSFTKSTS